MAITEHDRHALHSTLIETLGSERADTLMDHLPPVGWADVATKNDLRHLEERIDARLDRMQVRTDARFEQVDARFEQVDARFGADRYAVRADQ